MSAFLSAVFGSVVFALLVFIASLAWHFAAWLVRRL